MNERLVKVSELANKLGVGVRTVWRLRDMGKLPAPIKLGGATRWRESEISEWIVSGCPDVRRATECTSSMKARVR